MRRLQVLAVGLMGLAVAALVAALWSSGRAADIQGPVTLVATADGELWVGADERLWRIGADGTLRHDDDAWALGVPGTPATLNRHPQGGVVASVRHDPTLYRLDATTARVVGRVRPQWPAELAEHGSRAINVAVHADGRIAIATGGGHAVALFADDGRFIARTAPGAYRYTNGLWWAGDALWTTDTNRTQLKRLDGGTLAVQETVQLDAERGTRFLGPAREHARRPDRVAFIRYANGMTVGRVAVVEGRPPQERALDGAGVFEPHDVDWLGDDVVVTDGRTHRLLRVAADGGGLAVPFGDAEVQRRIDAGLAERDRAQLGWRLGLAAGAVLMLAAIGFAWRAQRLGRHALVQERPLDRSQLGTPLLPAGEVWRLRGRLALPWLLPLGLMAAMRALGPLWRAAPPGAARWAAVAGIAVLWASTFAAVWWAHRQQGRRSLEPRYEPVFNAFALKRLDADDRLRNALQPGEVLHETFVWVRHRVHWMVLTDRRLLCFTHGLRGWRLAEAPALARVQEVVYTPRAAGFWRRWLGAGAGGPGWLQMKIDGLGLWQGRVTAPPLAQRVARRLGGTLQAAG